MNESFLLLLIGMVVICILGSILDDILK